MSVASQQVYEDLINAIDKDQLVLPTLPEVALKAREVAEDPEVCGADLSKVVANDAALSARIIKVANSPLLRANRKIEDLLMAINRLGITFTANLITGLAMEQMFQATNDLVDTKMREIWSHSTEVAGIAHVLCKHFTKLKPDQATLAGLIHEIGALPILTYAEEHEELLQDKDSLDELIEKIHPMVGSKILKTWDFPEELQSVPENYLNFDRQAGEKADYVDIVMVANLQSYVDSDHSYTEMDWSKIPAFQRLGLDPDIDSQEGEDLSEQMKAAASLLQ